MLVAKYKMLVIAIEFENSRYKRHMKWDFIKKI